MSLLAPVVPSAALGRTTTTVGWFDVPVEDLARWLAEPEPEESWRWEASQAPATSLAGAGEWLEPSVTQKRHKLVPAGTWTVLMNNGPNGTDVGLLPSHVARRLGRRALRATTVPRELGFETWLVELYGPESDDPMKLIRAVGAANDGGRWTFIDAGQHLESEDTSRYAARRIRDRFGPDQVYSFLRGAGVPLDAPLDWDAAWRVEAMNVTGAS